MAWVCGRCTHPLDVGEHACGFADVVSSSVSPGDLSRLPDHSTACELWSDICQHLSPDQLMESDGTDTWGVLGLEALDSVAIHHQAVTLCCNGAGKASMRLQASRHQLQA